MAMDFNNGDSTELNSINRLRSVVSDGDAKLSQVVAAIDGDPRLTEILLQAANSAEMGLKHRIERLEHAVAILGLRRVAALVDREFRIDTAHTVPAPHRRSSANTGDNAPGANRTRRTTAD